MLSPTAVRRCTASSLILLLLLLLTNLQPAAAQQARDNGRGALLDAIVADPDPIAPAGQLPVDLISPDREEPDFSADTAAVPDPLIFLADPGADSGAGGTVAAPPPEEEADADAAFFRREDTPDGPGACPTETLEFRTIDGACNNQVNIRWGASKRGQVIFWDGPPSDRPTGGDRPGARLVSNAVSNQGEETIPNRRRMSDLVTFFGQFLDHTIVSTPASNSLGRFDIPIPAGDQFLPPSMRGKQFFELKRSARATTSKGERSVQNAISSFIDLSSVYGDNDGRASALRSFSGGKLKASAGDLLPNNSAGEANAPSESAAFFLAGDFRANEHVNLCVLHTVFMREHNRLAEALARQFPRWGDERLYQMARKMNGFVFQKIVYEEFYPVVTGRRAPGYQGYEPDVDPTVSSLFTTAAYRIGHTMVGPDVKRRGANNVPLPTLELEDVFFTAPRIFAQSQSPLEDFMRGMLSEPAQEVDVKVVPLLRNFLFDAVEEEDVFDLISFNIQRGRDHQLPAYNDVRERFGLSRAGSYGDITNDAEIVQRLATAYGPGGVDLVDCWVGMMAEPHIGGGSMGELTFRVWEQEFGRLATGDRFFYRNSGVLSRRVKSILGKIGGTRMRDVLLRNLNISPHEMPRDVWKVQRSHGYPRGGKYKSRRHASVLPRKRRHASVLPRSKAAMRRPSSK